MKILAIGDFHGKFPEKLKKLVKKEKPDMILSDGDYTGIEGWRKPLKIMFAKLAKGIDIHVPEILGKKRYLDLLKRDYAAGKIPLKELNKFRMRVFSVFGNGDWYKSSFNKSNRKYENLIKKLKNIKDINRGKASFRNIKIAGFGGYLDSDVYFTKIGIRAINSDNDDSMKRRKRYGKEEKNLMKLMRKKTDILLIHYTPYGCLDKMRARGFALTGSNMGISSFNRAIRKYSPALVVCGHMHENQGKCKLGSSLIVNPGAAVNGKCALIEFDEKRKKVLNVRFVK